MLGWAAHGATRGPEPQTFLRLLNAGYKNPKRDEHRGLLAVSSLVLSDLSKRPNLKQQS